MSPISPQLAFKRYQDQTVIACATAHLSQVLAQFGNGWTMADWQEDKASEVIHGKLLHT